MGYPHEYLVHGVVKGPWHKAIPYSAFQGTPKFTLWSQSCGFNSNGRSLKCTYIIDDDVRAARKMSTQCGENFALPMTLAILCCEKHEQELFKNGVGREDLEVLLNGIAGLKVPESWRKINKMTGHIITSDNFDDSK